MRVITRRPTRGQSLVFAAALGLTVSEARAEVAFAPLCESAAMRELMDDAAAELLRSGTDARVVSPRLLAAPACAVHATRLRRALLEEGRAHFRALDVDEAVRTLGTLVRVFEERPELLGDLEVLLEARTYLGWIAMERRDTAAAREHFRAVCAVARSWRPDPAQFPPPVQRGLALACSGELESGVLVVRGVTGKVWVDDVQRCDAPCSTNVAAGVHFVSVRGGEAQAHALVRVEAGAEVKVEVVPSPSLAARLEAQLVAGDVDALATNLKTLGRDAVVLVRATEEGVLAYASRAPFADVRGPLRVSAEGGQGLAPDVVSVLTAALASLPPSTHAGPVAVGLGAPADDAPLWRRWWLWAAVGAVAATAVASYVILAEEPERTLSVRMPLP